MSEISEREREARREYAEALDELNHLQRRRFYPDPNAISTDHVRLYWREGDWCAPLRLPERRG